MSRSKKHKSIKEEPLSVDATSGSEHDPEHEKWLKDNKGQTFRMGRLEDFFAPKNAGETSDTVKSWLGCLQEISAAGFNVAPLVHDIQFQTSKLKP